MKLRMSALSRNTVGLMIAAWPLLAACSATAPDAPSTSGGQSNVAGAPSFGGSGGAAGTTGGASGIAGSFSGGAPSGSGGAVSTTSGGAVSTTSGGAVSTTSGGAVSTTSGGASGGAVSTTSGGAVSTGGTTSSGGTTTSGGSSSGGATTSGGKTGSGGSGSGGTATSGGSGSGGAAVVDPKAILTTFRPKDSDLGELFDDYVNEEVGPLTNGTVGTGSARTITQTIFVAPGVIYDGKGEKLTAKGMGDGSQDEGQRPVFLLAPGAGVKNVTITAPGVEGIHMMGNNTVENVVWEDVGEDAASTRSYFPGGKISITGGSARAAADKTFQFNAPSEVTIKNFTANDVGKLVRQNGGKNFPLTIILDTVTVNNVKDAVVMSDATQCTVRYHALTSDAETLFEGPMKIETF